MTQTFNQLLVTTELQIVTYRIDTDSKTASRDSYPLANLTTLLVVLWAIMGLVRHTKNMTENYFETAIYLPLKVGFEIVFKRGAYASLIL